MGGLQYRRGCAGFSSLHARVVVIVAASVGPFVVVHTGEVVVRAVILLSTVPVVVLDAAAVLFAVLCHSPPSITAIGLELALSCSALCASYLPPSSSATGCLSSAWGGGWS